MIDRIQMMLVGLYVSGWLLDWAYWIAVGWSWSAAEGESIYVVPTTLGWVPAIFWPLHVLSETWVWALT